MNWHDKNTQSGQLVASQTTHGDYKDLHIVTVKGECWSMVSLQDGMCHELGSKDALIEWLNKYRHAPIVKSMGGGPLPENRAGLPMVQILGLRKNP
jgi:hypothetical protein